MTHSDTQGEQVKRLRQTLNTDDERAEAWRPEIGDELVGEHLGFKKGTTKRGPADIVLLRELDTGHVRAVWLFYKVLREEIQKQSLRPGDLVAIRRLEDGPNYRRYRVAVERKEERNELE